MTTSPIPARDHFDFSQEHHASSAGIPSALIEIRHDLIGDRDGIETYADMLGNAMEGGRRQPVLRPE